MKNLRMKNGFKRLRDADLCVKAGAILQNMTGNPHFPSPSPTLAALAGTINAYSNAVQMAEDKGSQQIAEKNALKALLINDLYLLSTYVLLCAAGDAIVAMTSGFGISKPSQSRPPLTKPCGLVLLGGSNRGELLLKLKRVTEMQTYRYEITPHPATGESKWEPSYNTVSKNTFTGLVSGREYCCRVAAIGVRNQVVYSDVVTRIAL